MRRLLWTGVVSASVAQCCLILLSPVSQSQPNSWLLPGYNALFLLYVLSMACYALEFGYYIAVGMCIYVHREALSVSQHVADSAIPANLSVVALLYTIYATTLATYATVVIFFATLYQRVKPGKHGDELDQCIV